MMDQGMESLTFGYSDDDFQTISSLMRSETGVSLGKAKSAFVYSRLTKRLRSLGLKNFRDYCALVKSENGSAERKEMIAALTTNVPKFFREAHHFSHLKVEVERLAGQIQRGRRLRIWSAACSNGQEAFSIVMTIFSVLPEADRLDVKILATDVDRNMIEAARSAEYPDDAVAAIPAELREKWVRRSSRSDYWTMNERLSSIITFRELNLIGHWPMKHRFDSIFCRNVAIYFEEETQQEIWRKFVPALVPGGLLHIGHSERISGPANCFLVNEGVTTYRLIAGEK
jgi:chemotaxis protein methyltransferase CheR